MYARYPLIKHYLFKYAKYDQHHKNKDKKINYFSLFFVKKVMTIL